VEDRAHLSRVIKKGHMEKETLENAKDWKENPMEMGKVPQA
jgi:hypothetical protein